MKITTCAIRMPNGCIVSMERPARHHHILNAHGGLADGEQGFLTDEGRFVDRVDARFIAEKSRQIVREVGNIYELFSENLW